jgi:hypothetical protein
MSSPTRVAGSDSASGRALAVPELPRRQKIGNKTAQSEPMLLHASAAAALSAAATRARRRRSAGAVTQCVASPPRLPDAVAPPEPPPLRLELPASARERTVAGGVRAALRRRPSAQRERLSRGHAGPPVSFAAPPPAGPAAEPHAPARDAVAPVARTGRVDSKKIAVRARGGAITFLCRLCACVSAAPR